MTASSGTPQSHTVNGPFGAPLAVTVTTNGAATSGVEVTFTAPASGASGTFADSGAITTTAKTNAQGVATASAFTANGTAGAYAVKASVSKGAAPVNFSLTNTVGAPAAISTASGAAQNATVNQPFAAPLAVTVTDSGHNPVGNAIVVFTAPSTGASGTFAGSNANTMTASTNASGVAVSAVFTANGVSGADSVMATVSGVLSPASFNLTNVAGPPAAITAVGGAPQSVIGNTTFPLPLTASVVDNLQNPVIGAQVTFTAPTTGASGTFAGTASNTATVATDTNGIATAPALTANASGGSFTVTASVTEVSAPASFDLTNWTVGSKLYSFYLAGQEVSSGFPVFYGLAGSVVIDPSGNVLAGEQDYNDAFGKNSPQPSGDTISGGTLTLDATTGAGKLTLTTSNSKLGVAGVETLAVQFVNLNHALVIQYDGSATSSGSLDVQTLPSTPNGGYAFAMTGVDPFVGPVAFGGVFSISGGTTLQNGLLDMNDFGTVTLATPLTGTLTPADSFGRGNINSTFNYPAIGTPVALNYYIVGPEVMRIIDVDPADSAVGSAYGQGVNATSASNTSLPTSVFGVQGNTLSYIFGTVGQFSTNPASASFSGVADDSELLLGLSVPDASISGTYSIASNGYGTFTITPGALGDVSSLGIYMTDPNLNLNDPNNTTSGLGGALVVDMDDLLSGAVGFMVPQTDTSTASFAGSYAFGIQDQNFFQGLFDEADYVARGTVANGTLSGIGAVSDPSLATLGTPTTIPGVVFLVQPLADPSNPGRYTMLNENSPPNPVGIKIQKNKSWFDVVMYQANGGQLIWLNIDPYLVSEYFGPLEQQGSLIGLPAAKADAAKPRAKQK